MKDRRRLDTVSALKRSPLWKNKNTFFLITLFFFFCCYLFTFFNFSTFKLFQVSFRPVLILKWPNLDSNSVLGENSLFRREVNSNHNNPAIKIQSVLILPDQLLLFVEKNPYSKQDLECIYNSPETSEPQLKFPVMGVDEKSADVQIVRCPLQPLGFNISLAGKVSGETPGKKDFKSLQQAYHWDSLVYEALVDGNTIVVFVKGLNLRSEKISDPSGFTCVFSFHGLEKTKFLLTSKALTVAQEIVRCSIPLSLQKDHNKLKSLKVSVKPRKRNVFPSLARLESDYLAGRKKEHTMCVCTMVRNQARFLKEWIVYHGSIGVHRWFIYDNNSEDPIEQVIESLKDYNVTRHVWPWVKTQEAGFSHCVLRARHTCEWVGFIDVDEFIYFPSSNRSLEDVIGSYSSSPTIGELRTWCHSFGPSGLRRVPEQGVTVGYTCRLAGVERHKSIVRPEAIDSTLINVVHHFRLRDGFRHENVGRGLMVINHYKYQVWEVFKNKFYRRVAAYVADWNAKENEGSRDRAPGLGTEAVEPPDWQNRFCEVNDTGLKDWVLGAFTDLHTKLLPWQPRIDL